MTYYTKPGSVTVWATTPHGEMEVARVGPATRPMTLRRADARLFAAAPDLLAALRIGLHHTQRAAGWTKDAHRRAIDAGMHGTAATHDQAWQDTLAAIEVIEAAINKAEGQQ